MALIGEADWDSAALEVLAEQGWAPTTGAVAQERASGCDLVLTEQVLAASDG